MPKMYGLLDREEDDQYECARAYAVSWERLVLQLLKRWNEPDDFEPGNDWDLPLWSNGIGSANRSRSAAG